VTKPNICPEVEGSPAIASGDTTGNRCLGASMLARRAAIAITRDRERVSIDADKSIGGSQ
jgi:hypothetical protein